ncbi:DNase I-like protein [Cristinia sonorae]|uniref:DNase I-like protein n=1 Tax=Cristinia sonorae TaxID=1940300 RepID=A0A8K0UPQ4_9AGAR|nr:DNase I-like protein [Cristinia sonorae]
MRCTTLTSLAALFTAAASTKIVDIQGVAFQSALAGQWVHNVTGVVTAKDRYGFWVSGEPSDDTRASNGLRVYSPTVAKKVEAGDLVSLSGRVSEFRQASRPNDLYLTELEIPYNLDVLSTGNVVKPVVLSRDGDRIPPSTTLSAHDTGPDGWLSVPNNVTLLESANATLYPNKYGLDFWESLEGMLVTIPSPVAANFPDMFGSVWVYGDWDIPGRNERGGLTITFVDETPDAHPGTILVGKPLDGTRLPKSVVGMALSDITGVVTYQFGYYSVLPLTAPTVLSVPSVEVTPATFSSGTQPCEITIGDYNVENMSPRSHHIPRIAEHIVKYLNSPDIVFLQEIQDDSGPRNDGVVTANKTLTALVRAITKEQAGHPHASPDSRLSTYSFVDIPPENNMDGGKAGGNIRVAYLWRPDRVTLLPGYKGNATRATEVVKDGKGTLSLSLNPGRIDPMSIAWEDTRKPLAAAWQTITGERFFTVNVHLSSKRDSSSQHGDARPPVNGHAERRTHQVNITAAFVESILSKDPLASVILAGDMNDFIQTRSVFRALDPLLHDINEVSNIDPVERYTYVYEQHTQEIDHMFVSDAVAARGTEVEHVHVNTWAGSANERASDHDPSVAKIWVCDKPREVGQGLVVQIPGGGY